MKRNSRIVLLVLCLAMIFLLCGCGSSSSGRYATDSAVYGANGTYNGYENAAVYEAESLSVADSYAGTDMKSAVAGGGGFTSTVIADTKDTKLVYTANVTAETKEFESDTQALAEMVASLGGYISESEFSDSWRYGYSSGYRQQYISIRIPTAKYTEFMQGLRGIGHVTSTSDSVEDITRSYYSTKTSLGSLNLQLQFLQGMYAEAKTIDDMLSIRDRIVDVENDIKYLTIRINTMDDQVAYSTIHYTLTEVVEYSETIREEEAKTFGQKFVDALKADWAGLVSFVTGLILFLAGNLWWIVLLAVVVIIIVTDVKRRQKAAAEAKRKLHATEYVPVCKSEPVSEKASGEDPENANP